MTDDPPESARRRVRRGEGEVTEWPRGLLDYTSTDEDERPPPPEDDRDRNRLRLAARLLGVARAHGHAVDGAVARLRSADRAFREGHLEKGRRIVEDVIVEVEALTGDDAAGTKPTS